MTLPGRAADALGRALSRPFCRLFLRRPNLFDTWQACGWHVVPNHFYEPVPDTRTLDSRLFDKPSGMPGVDLRLDAQRGMLKRFAAEFGAEYNRFPEAPVGPQPAVHLKNGMFGPGDAETLYCMVRANRPRRIIEIGSGFSTLFALEAVRATRAADPGYSCEVTCVEPYPRDWLRTLKGIKLVQDRVETLPLSLFEGLGEGDILFMDSSHVLKIGSDVHYEFLELIPRVGVGALVHVHDIFFPMDYPRDWVLGKRRFWTEQYLLQAFLAFNRAFRVEWAGAAMLRAYPEDVFAAYPSTRRGSEADPQFGIGSFWMKRTAA